MGLVTLRIPKKTQKKNLKKVGLPFSSLGINIQIIILIKQTTTMKKFLAIALIAASFTACNDSEKKTEETKSDTTVTVVPTADTVKTITDTTIKTTTEVVPAADTTKK